MPGIGPVPGQRMSQEHSHGVGTARAVRIFRTDGNDAMLPPNLVCIGITRGKQLVVLVGRKKALAMAVRNHLGRRRFTKLAEWLH